MHKIDNCCTKEITIPKCCDSILNEVCLPITESGKILAINLILKHVLVNKRISIAVLVFEGKILKGFKVRTINTGSCDSDNYNSKDDSECSEFLKYKAESVYKNVKSGNFYFVFPSQDECENKRLKIKIITHYTDINLNTKKQLPN